VIPQDILRLIPLQWARRLVVALALALVFFGIACRHGSLGTGEYVYVSAPQANLRDRIAAVYNKVGVVKNGDRLMVLDRQKRFIRVRTAAGEEGWIEQRYVVAEDIFKGFDKLAAENKNVASLGKGVARADLNMHLTPGRDAEALYRLAEGEKAEILRRATTERPEKQEAMKPAPRPEKPGVKAEIPKETPKLYDDWWLVRNKDGRYGWVLARMIDLDIPLEIAQYAEGQRIQGAFVLNEMQDGDKKVPQYLVLMTEPRDGMPFDYNQARVFTWNLKKHRYETAYRERNLVGFFPVKVGSEEFDKEGTLPTFTLRAQTEDGNIVERKYKLNQPIVRRVIVPGETQVKLASASKSEPKRPTSSKKKKH
jgi:SH3-like domain-containing protein